MRARSGFLISLCLIVMTGLAFAPVSRNAFVGYDDDIYVSDNPHLRGGLTWENVRWAFSANLAEVSPNADYWIPATLVSHLLLVQLFGMHPAAHHAANVVLHAVNTVLLFLLLRRMTGALWRSALVAALFAVHPLHVESVAWVVERKDVLSTLFLMLTIRAYLWYVERSNPWRYLLVVLAFACGLMAKPMLVTLPGILLLLDYWPLGRLAPGHFRTWSGSDAVWRLVWEKLPLFALAAADALITYLTTQARGVVLPLETVSLPTRMENVLLAYVRYIGKMFWPHNLAAFYPYPGSPPPLWSVAGAAVVMGGITMLVLVAGRRRPYLPVGWLWYVGSLVPVIGLVQAGEQAMADRYTYVPLIGLFVMIAWGVPDLTAGCRRQKKLLATAAAGTLAALAAATWVQAGYWRSSATLFEHALQVTTENYMAHDGLASDLAGRGRLVEAERHYREALRIKPDFAEAHNNLGVLLARQRKFDEAVAHFSQALRLRPALVRVHNNLGLALAQQGRPAEAMVQFAEAIRLIPDFAEAHNNLGLVLAQQGRLDEAIMHFSQAVRINPGDAEARRNLDAARLQQRDERPDGPK